jgi:redox-sensitive bicupin YhaK (pirin superfamily)
MADSGQMSPVQDPQGDEIIEGRPRDLGGFEVRRVLPSRARQRVGPFIFFDHFGPVTFAAGHGMDVRPHPHIALATLTYLFEGEILHRDSLGSQQVIRPGDVNWMVAGRGIVHSERTPVEARARGGRLHGIQTWLALPRELEESAPRFEHHGTGSIPIVRRDGVELHVVAGTAYGATAPTGVLSATLYVAARLAAGASLAVDLGHEQRAVYVVAGTVLCGERPVAPGSMMVLPPGAERSLRASTAAQVLLIGGAPLAGERHLYWNFVSSSEERIERAKADWRDGRFPKVPGDEVHSSTLRVAARARSGPRRRPARRASLAAGWIWSPGWRAPRA